MIRNETDLTMTGFFVKDYLTRDFEFTLPVYMDDLCCYVQKAKRIPQSIVPLFAVHIDIWLGFLLVGIVCPPIWMLLRRINLFLNIQIDSKMPVRASFGKPFQYMRIFIDTWVVWVRVNIVRYPPYFSERIFVISLCLVSVIFGALFESSLATVYIKPLRYADINSLEELNEAISKIFIKHAAMKDDLFAGHSSEIYKSLNEKLILVAELEERLIEVMSKRGGFAAVTRSSSLDLVDIRYFQTQKIHKIKECPKQYFISFLLAKHSPYEDVINVNLLKVVQGGFFNYWIGDSKHQAKIKMHKFPDYLEASAGYVWKVLTLNDLQLSFIAWSLGVILSFVSLGIELLLRKKNQLKLFK